MFRLNRSIHCMWILLLFMFSFQFRPINLLSQQTSTQQPSLLFGISALDNGLNRFVHIDPTNADETVVSNVGDMSVSFFGGIFALNPFANEFYMIRQPNSGSLNLIAINTETGAVSERGSLNRSYIALGFNIVTRTYLPLIQGVTNRSDSWVQPTTCIEAIS
jgi:hypothetical protein